MFPNIYKNLIRNLYLYYKKLGLKKFIYFANFKFQNFLKNLLIKLKFVFLGSYLENETFIKFKPRIKNNSEIHNNNQVISKNICNNYLEHKFNILGSGWINVKYGIDCKGILGFKYKDRSRILKKNINFSNRNLSRNITKLISSDYTPIDWHIDFKSGYRWQEHFLSDQIKYGNKKGADVKVPWELSRMQHLPQMALFAVQNKNKKIINKIIFEIKDQILDFIASNPPGFGVNWISPMEVGIRASNWILTLDIIYNYFNKFKNQEIDIILKSILKHGQFIIDNLEWSFDRNNHYYSNICSLVFISSYIHGPSYINYWLSFSINEFRIETLRQFGSDGGNFEGSTAYHRFGFEMLCYTSSIILGCSKKRLNLLEKIKEQSYKKLNKNFIYNNDQNKKPYYILKEEEDKYILFSYKFMKRLYNCLDFTKSIIFPDNCIIQIGDNDSGRFFKVLPLYEKLLFLEAKKRFYYLFNNSENIKEKFYFNEIHNYGMHQMDQAVGLGLIDNPNKKSIETLLIELLCNGKKLKIENSNLYNKTNIKKSNFLELIKKDSKEEKILILNKKIKFKNLTKNDLTYKAFKEFGLYIWKINKIAISIRAIKENQKLTSGHFHSDQLSINLYSNNKYFLRDPGTFCYTPFPKLRNYFRSRVAHFPSLYMIEKNNNLFEGPKINQVFIKYVGKSGFLGHYKNNEVEEILRLIIKNNVIDISFYIKGSENGYKKQFKKMIENKLPYSPSYGILARSNYDDPLILEDELKGLF